MDQHFPTNQPEFINIDEIIKLLIGGFVVEHISADKLMDVSINLKDGLQTHGYKDFKDCTSDVEQGRANNAKSALKKLSVAPTALKT